MAKEGNEAMVLLDEASVQSTPRAAANPAFSQNRKQSGLWREAQATCRLLLLDFSNSNAIFVSRVLEWAAIWTQPDTRLVGMGENVGVMTLLLHPGLRNTHYALYVTKQFPGKNESKKGVEVWRRCVYCENGEAGVERLGRWNETKPGIPGHPSLFRDRYENYNRHKFRLLEKNFFPYLKFERLSDEPGSLVRHRDAFGTRVIEAMSNSLNFT
ncbi:hypothetical protein Pmani_026345 [Petrolisthes manimaculis]|uniref:Uncharacterized protein n=1 Tax=Petrolisthes manimaculis TaxID=1843537 RepID=A0AAE1P6E8_9EUCA|nr:hypothetical protein Pmani_026345 [Petrolisthes manimaculis]